jgi:hypothetical protein
MKKILVNPITIFLSIIFGVLMGVFYPSASADLEFIGSVYLSLLKVVVLPFLLATILVGVVSLLQKEDSAGMIRKIIVGFIASMILASAIGVVTVTLMPSDVSSSKMESFGNIINSKDSGASDLEVTLFGPQPEVRKPDPFAIFNKFIPENIFSSLNGGESLKVVIFCLIFGISLGFVKNAGQQMIVDCLRAVQEASIAIFKFLNYFLPFALFAMISSQVGKVGVGIFLTMIDFIYQQALVGLIIILVSTAVLVIRSKSSIVSVIRSVKETLIVAVSSRSSLACIPYAQESLTSLRFNKGAVELMVPLSFTVNRIGSIAYYAVATIFIANVYGVSLGVGGFVVVIFGSVLAGLASAGTTGVLTVATVSIVCDLLMLPHEAIIVLMIVVDPIMDMIRTASHVYGNVAVSSFVCDREENT